MSRSRVRTAAVSYPRAFGQVCSRVRRRHADDVTGCPAARETIVPSRTADRLLRVRDDGTQGCANARRREVDYGAPTGFRVAMAHPERVTALISQNGNAYEEGLSEGWNPIQRYWRDRSEANRQALRELLTPASIRWQYEHGVPDTSLVSPDGSALDAWYIQRPEVDEIQLDLFGDYASNVALYPAFQTYFRTHRPRLLVIWGRNDPFFLPAGAEAFRRDIPDAQIRFLDTGHFALETHAAVIAEAIADFLHA